MNAKVERMTQEALPHIFRLAVFALAAMSVAAGTTPREIAPMDAQQRLMSRDDCLAWHSFVEIPKGMTFVPATEKDLLVTTPGGFAGQTATRIFHGQIKGPVLDIPATGFTLCCWLKINKLQEVPLGDDTPEIGVGGVMASGSGYYNGWRLLVTPATAMINFAIGGPESRSGLRSTGFLTSGEWHHVAVTWDHKKLALWIDGVLRAETTEAITYHPSATIQNFRIGECGEGTGVLDFEIADLGVFSAALPGEAFDGLGNADVLHRRRLTAMLRALPAPPKGMLFRGMRERRYREKFNPLIALTERVDTPAAQEVYPSARLLVAESFQRSGDRGDAEKVLQEIAAAESAPLHLRARAMFMLGDLPRDQRDYTAARHAYEKAQDFFVAKHEAFRVEAITRLRDIETLADDAPFRSERQRRIDRMNRAKPWFYLAPDGDDANPGTASRPFRTLEQARDALRERRKGEPLPEGGVAIVLKGGAYPCIEKSFMLTSEDSGTATAPIVYRAASGEQPILQAGHVITGFAPVTDTPAVRRIPAAAREHVLQADLRAAGITEYGHLTPRGRGDFGKLAGMDVPAHMEVFFNGVAMPLARWPNDTPKMSERFALVELGDQRTESSSGRNIVKNSDLFYYSDERQDAWANEPDPWMFGYWQYTFFSSYRKILNVDPEKNQIQIDWNLPPESKGQSSVVRGSGYQGINLLCELDSPGEWYLDRDAGMLYFWPPSPIGSAETLVSMLETPVVTMAAVSNVVLRGLTIEAGRQHGVTVKEGESVLLAGCVIRDMGCTGAEIAGGWGHALIGCDLSYLGNAGVMLEGGDLPTLAPSGHVVENCHIHHYAHWNRGAYQPAIGVKGVGVRMSHNLIHDAPHQGILLFGNDHVTEYNEVHDVTHEAGDAGAWYMYGGEAAIAERGNVVRYNYWHHLPHNETLGKFHCVCRMGIYIDHMNGGVTVYGNVFSRIDVDQGTVYFGGSDDIVENNVFHRCLSGIRIIDRSWIYKGNKKTYDDYLAKMKVTEPPWSIRYPRLTTIKPDTQDMTLLVRGNVAARNVAIDCKKFIYGYPSAVRYARIERNWEANDDAGFLDADGGDFRLKPDAPVLDTCMFEPLPFEKMGLYNDELRARWPVDHPSGNYETFYRKR